MDVWVLRTAGMCDAIVGGSVPLSVPVPPVSDAVRHAVSDGQPIRSRPGARAIPDADVYAERRARATP